MNTVPYLFYGRFWHVYGVTVLGPEFNPIADIWRCSEGRKRVMLATSKLNTSDLEKKNIKRQGCCLFMELFERDLWPEGISDLRIAPNLIHKRVQLTPISFHLGQLVLHLCCEEDLSEMMWFTQRGV